MTNLPDILSKCLASDGICIDSRYIKPNDFFVALRGPIVDGNTFAKEAIEKGARFALIDNEAYHINDQCILVDNALDTLQSLAKLHRKNLKNIPIIAVAGSNGKTTTKELIYSVLSKKFNAYRTHGNLNNHIGVPISILEVTSDIEIAIIEMGANHIGEHALLCDICQPNFGLVTNCGKDHLEGYGSEDAVIASNKEMYDYLLAIGGHAFVNSGNDVLCAISNGVSRTFYGQNKSDNVVFSEMTEEYPTLTLNIMSKSDAWSVSSKLYGHFQEANIVAAISVGVYFDVDQERIKEAIETYEPLNNRSQVITWNGNTVLLDAYNANPSSMMAIIDYFDRYPAKQKIIILGSMEELGTASDKEHSAIIERLKNMKCEHIFLIGGPFKSEANDLDCMYFNDTNKMKGHMAKQSFQGYSILVKGSRKHALEQLFINH